MNCERPVIVLGDGVRAEGADPSRMLHLEVPVLSSWQGADLVDNWHPNYLGRPGIYGWRAANKVLYEADLIISIGCRLSAWLVGHTGLRPEQKVIMADCDGEEAMRINAEWDKRPLQQFMDRLELPINRDWIAQCHKWADENPLIEQCHADTPNDDYYLTYANAYKVMAYVNGLLAEDHIVITDCGSHMCPVFQAMRFRPPQRVMTSGGLGEMGCALPAAVGAAFASKSPVLAVIGDGGMMMNLQELATISYHGLPVKIIVFANDGYSMIKGTFNNVQRPRVGVDKASGMRPAKLHSGIASGFSIPSSKARTWNQIKMGLELMFSFSGPYLLEIEIDPEQDFVPRLKPIRQEDGTFKPARFDQLSPIR